ncbi:MAG: hypothetical protein NZM29_02270, partial [Nitrospira sp.]|nr:hypothetical protein [Nitrospira sp.]
GQIAALQKQKLDVETAAQAEIEKLKIELGRANKLLEERKNPLQEVVSRRSGDQHALLLDISRGIPLWDKPVGRITRVDLDRRQAYIDVGSERGVQPEMTFCVFADDGKGQADKFLKGTLEVIRVIDATSSLCRITSLYDASGVEIALNDPTRGRTAREVEEAMREKDLIFNMFWNAPVAIAGIIHWSGPADTPAEQMRQLAAFGQLLHRMNMRIDAYVDLNEGQIKGAITPRTRYLILGDPAYPKNPNDESQKDRAKAINDLIAAMKKDAIDHGLFLISADNFMIASGFRPPRNALDNSLGKFQGSVPFANASATGLIIQRDRPAAQGPPMDEKKEPEAKEKKEPEGK